MKIFLSSSVEREATTIAEEFYKDFLHGELVIQIVKAEGLCNEDDGVKPYSLQNLGRCIPAKRAFTFSKNFSDPFVCIYLGESCICQTSWISDRLVNNAFNAKDYSIILLYHLFVIGYYCKATYCA